MNSKIKNYKRMTVSNRRDVKESFQDFVEYIMGTRLKGCLKKDCLENNHLKCNLKHMSIGISGECTFYTERDKKYPNRASKSR